MLTNASHSRASGARVPPTLLEAGAGVGVFGLVELGDAEAGQDAALSTPHLPSASL